MINITARRNIRREIQLLQHFIEGNGVEFADVDLLICSVSGDLDDSL